MSQHIYSTITGDGESVTVTLGYDRPLDYVFCTVQRESDADDAPFYSNLDDKAAGIGEQNVEYYRPILHAMGIQVPETMFFEVAEDQRNRTGNRIVEHGHLLAPVCNALHPTVPGLKCTETLNHEGFSHRNGNNTWLYLESAKRSAERGRAAAAATRESQS